MTKLEEIRERMKDARETGAATEIEAVVHFHPDLLALCEEQDRELREAVELMTALVNVVDAHDIDSLSCDRDGKEYCDCLGNAVGRIQAFLARHKENDHE